MKEKFTVKATAKKIYKRKLMMRISTIMISFLLLTMSLLYCILYIVNTKGNFTISLDPNLKATKDIVISATSDFKEKPLLLETPALDYMDNISESWLPKDIDNHEGAHNGNNYLAYTFFVKNEGETKTNYIVSIDILSVIKNVDEAIRVAVYTNGKKEVYAKKSKSTKQPENNTIEFENSSQVMMKVRKNFKNNEVDKYTVVVWLEGDDPECKDDILGGEMKMKMSLAEDKGN